MLIRFRVQNHRSIRDEQTLSMVATEPLDDARLITTPAIPEKLVRVAAIYGANASGKSNVLEAFTFASRCVRHSHNKWEPTAEIAVQPFAFEVPETNSTYEFDFIVADVRYTYGFELSRQRVESEWLSAWTPAGEEQPWFRREHDHFEFLGPLTGNAEIVAGLTRANSLLLSAAAQNNHHALTPIFKWFGPVPPITTERVLAIIADAPEPVWASLRGVLLSLLMDADTGIIGLRVRNRTTEPLLEFLHRARTDPEANAWLPLERESRGTERMLQLGLPMSMSSTVSGHMLVDELEASLHPSLTLALLRAVQVDSASKAQLIFTTHDALLLAPLVGDPVLRRDQIWVTEKSAEGVTELYSLADYEPTEGNENLARGYLQGRYGAVPFLGDLSAIFANSKAS